MEENQPQTLTKRRKEFYLPLDSQYDIFMRLPTKSLMRFKSLCKHWCDMISDSCFAALHLRQRMSKIMITSFHNAPYRYCSYKLNEEGLREIKSASLPLEEAHYFPKACCNSLTLFQQFFDQKKMYVYDATSRRTKLLPRLQGLNLYLSYPVQANENLTPPQMSRYLLGEKHPYKTQNNIYSVKPILLHNLSLVYDASSEKYKVIVFAICVELDVITHCYIYSLGMENEFKGLESGLWRRSKLHVWQRMMTNFVPIVLKGMLYWIAQSIVEFKGFFIQPMNIVTEEFMKIILVPPSWSSNRMQLLEMKGSVCLMNPTSDIELDIWLLKDSVRSFWIKQHKLSLSNAFHPRLVLEGCNNLTYILVQKKFELYWFNMVNQELMHIDNESRYCQFTFSIMHG